MRLEGSLGNQELLPRKLHEARMVICMWEVSGVQNGQEFDGSNDTQIECFPEYIIEISIPIGL